jgi:glucuronoarabinoxylan endo-1,4-beta-xylanase
VNSVPTGTGQKHIWQTEWSSFDPWNPSWDNSSNASGFTTAQPTAIGTAIASNNSDASGFTWAQHLYTGLTVANLSAFFYWWGLAFNSTDNGGLIRYNNNALEISKRFWALANYSRFVLSGAIRIGTTSSNQNLKIASFRNSDGSLAIVVLNTSKSNTPVTFSLQNTGITQNSIVIPYITDSLNNTARQASLPIHNRIFSATVQARSLVTYQVTTSEPAVAPTLGLA